MTQSWKNIADFLPSDFQERWDFSRNSDTTHLLRLVMLRELHKETAEKRANCEAAGIAKTADQLKQVENILKSHVFSLEFPDSLDEILTKAADPKTLGSRPDLPASLTAAIGPGKLDKPERDWDLVIAHHAALEGWIFGALTFTVSQEDLHRWESRLQKSAWPTGTLLFSEKADQAIAPGFWCGRWYLCYDSRFPSPDSWWKEIRNWPGSAISPEEEINWKVLFPPDQV